MKKPMKEKLALSWHCLGSKHEELCEKLGLYLEEKKKHHATRSDLAPWRSRPERTTNEQAKHLW
jgi:hypothetical protein